MAKKMSCRARFPALAASALLFLACASEGGVPKEGALDAPPSNLNGFAPNIRADLVEVRVRYIEDHEKVFDEDLIGDNHVLPIAIKVGLKGAGAELATVYANPQQMDFRLYLEDGTALHPVTPAAIAKGDAELERKLSARALPENDLPAFEKATDKYLFFRLDPAEDFEFSGNKVVHKDGHVKRTLAIEHSLMAFRVKRDGRSIPVYIGLTRMPHSTD